MAKKLSTAPSKEQAVPEQVTKSTPIIIITVEQLKTLEKISTRIHAAKNNVSDIGEEGIKDRIQIGYLAGQAFSDLNRAEDTLDELIEQISPSDLDSEDDSWE